MKQQNATKKAFEVTGSHNASLDSTSSEIREVEKDYDYTKDADVTLHCTSYQPNGKYGGSHYNLIVRTKDTHELSTPEMSDFLHQIQALSSEMGWELTQP